MINIKGIAALIAKNRSLLFSIIISVYALPILFTQLPDYSLEGSWKMTENYAIYKSFVFGKDIIFTYGPLGFLSTRNNEFINSFLIFLADLFLLIGICHILYKYASRQKGWLLVSFIAVLFLRTSNYTQVLFLLFSLYTALNFKNSGANSFELAFGSFAGILLFFIKLNYGLISFAFIAITMLLLLLKSPGKALFYLLLNVTFFGIICLCVHIDLAAYIKNSLLQVSAFDESGYRIIDAKQPQYPSALLLAGLFLLSAVNYFYKAIAKKSCTLPDSLFFITLAFAFFLFYKNGFTRADNSHYVYFFNIIPFFFLAVYILSGAGNKWAGKLVVLLSIVIPGYNLMLIQTEFDPARYPAYFAGHLSTMTYFKGLFHPEKTAPDVARSIPPAPLNQIGNAKIDILTWETSLLINNQLNYTPRPLFQSFMAYSGALDSVNAHHFFKPGRPEFILSQNFSIDGRYYFWDESFTNATIHLNYEVTDSFNFDGTKRLEHHAIEDYFPYRSYLLLRAKKNAAMYPQFTPISNTWKNMGDTVQVNFDDTDAVYMTANIQYDLSGKMRRLFYQVPALNVTLFYDDTCQDYRVVVPIIHSPVLINKAVIDNSDLANFYTGNLRRKRRIKAFCFHAVTGGIALRYQVSFMKLSNY